MLPAVGVVNVRTAVCEIIRTVWGSAALEKLKSARGVGTTTFAKWFQLRLGELLIEKGCTQAIVANDDENPHFMPKHPTYHWRRRFIPPIPRGTDVSHPFAKATDLSLRPRAIPRRWDSNTLGAPTSGG